MKALLQNLHSSGSICSYLLLYFAKILGLKTAWLNLGVVLRLLPQLGKQKSFLSAPPSSCPC